MNDFEKRLKQTIAQQIPDLAQVTPGIAFDVHVRGRRKGTLRVGQTYDYYDLASLTKIIFSASACMHYFARHPRELKNPVHDHVSWWKARTRPLDLLTHTAATTIGTAAADEVEAVAASQSSSRRRGKIEEVPSRAQS